MDSRSTQVAFIEDATLALEWEQNHNNHYGYIDDGELAIELFAEETRAIAYEETDYTLARRMQEVENGGVTAGPFNHRRTRSADVVMGRPSRSQQQREEMHAKVSAIVGRVAHTFVRRRGTVGPGLARRTFLNRPLRKPESHECVICRVYITEVAVRVPCGHHYDIDCLRDLIQASTRDESLFPPRCCQQSIPRGLFEPHLDFSLSALFSEKSIEFGTLKRVYCARPTCSRFLGPRTTSGAPYIFICAIKTCCTQTCSRCRQEVKGSAKHTCPSFEKVEKEIVKLSRKTGWAPCPGCERVIELRAGCFHMTCICKTQFCYRCCKIWKTCKCPQWDELHLTEETERRISLLPPLQAMNTRGMLPEVIHPATQEPFLFRPVNRAPALGRAALAADTQNPVTRGRSPSRAATLPSPESGSPPTPPPKRSTTDGIFNALHTNSPPGPEEASGSGTQLLTRASAPAVMKARESIVARGVHAQERRLCLSHRRKESPPKVPRTTGTPDHRAMDVLEERINRLLRVVEHFPCRHQWMSENEQSVCDGCFRTGSSLAICSKCAVHACTRCQVNRI